jgi:hypothetical protein
MPCKIQIKQLLENLVDAKTQQGLLMKFKDAQELALKTNMEFKSHVVSFNKTVEGFTRSINIDSTLVDRYYDKQVKQQILDDTLSDNLVDNVNITTPNTLEIDLQSLNLTPEVVNYLYQDSRLKTIGLDLNAYHVELSKLISNLRTSFTNQEILEKIKCL